MISYLIDGFLAVMMVMATGYLLVVNRRLKALRDGQSEINELISTFSRTIDETDASVRRLVGAASEVAGTLGGEVDRGKTLKEEVGILLGLCERTVVRMQDSLRETRMLLRHLDEGISARTGIRPAPPTAAPPERAKHEADSEAPPSDETAPFRELNAAELASRPKSEGESRREVGEFYSRLRTLETRN